MPPWKNTWLILGVAFPLVMHLLLLYVPILSSTFGVVPLTLDQWKVILLVAFPILVLEEILKLYARHRVHKF